MGEGYYEYAKYEYQSSLNVQSILLGNSPVSYCSKIIINGHFFYFQIRTIFCHTIIAGHVVFYEGFNSMVIAVEIPMNFCVYKK